MLSPDDKVRMLEEPLPGFVWGRKNNKSREIEEWVRIAEGLAADNGGILPGPGFLKKNRYAALSSAIGNHPERFSHIPQKKKANNKKIDEWVLIAERLANENGGLLPIYGWLRGNGYKRLLVVMGKNPTYFSHIKRQKRGKTPEEWVLVAERLAEENGGVLPRPGLLGKNGHAPLYAAILKNRELFSHIKMDRKNTPHETLIEVAEKLARDNGGAIPRHRWLRRNNYRSLIGAMQNYPDKFTHLKKQSVVHRSCDEWVKVAEGLAKKNGGVLPNSNRLRALSRRGISVASAIARRPEKFSHIPQDNRYKKQAQWRLCVEKWVSIANKLAADNGGILPIRKRIHHSENKGLIPMMKKYPDKFAHLKQEKPTKTIEQMVEIAGELARGNGGLLPSISWLCKNRYRGLVSRLYSHPESFSHIRRQKECEVRRVESR